MGCFTVEGGKPLSGEVVIQGAKNSVLPILAATLLSGGQCCLEHCPRLRDVDASVRILQELGCGVQWQGTALTVDAADIERAVIPHGLMREMRSSAIFLGAMLARCGRAELSYPGGCDALWCRPTGNLPGIDIQQKTLPVTRAASFCICLLTGTALIVCMVGKVCGDVWRGGN